MNAQRLLRLAEHLDTVPEEEFNLGYWKCGSAACAIGHACRIPEFRKAGLRLVGPLKSSPEYKGAGGFDAAESFFELLNGDEARYLFSQQGYYGRTPPAAVAARIREFVANGGNP